MRDDRARSRTMESAVELIEKAAENHFSEEAAHG
jgi:hypothetical protein